VPPAATSATVGLLTPAKVTAPAVGTWAAPGKAPRAALEVAWTHDPAAIAVEIEVRAATQGPSGYVSWSVHAPATRKTFKFFPLPPSATPSASFPTGTHRIKLTQHASPALKGASDRWARPDGPEGLGLRDYGHTIQWNIVSLE